MTGLPFTCKYLQIRNSLESDDAENRLSQYPGSVSIATRQFRLIVAPPPGIQFRCASLCTIPDVSGWIIQTTSSATVVSSLATFISRSSRTTVTVSLCWGGIRKRISSPIRVDFPSIRICRFPDLSTRRTDRSEREFPTRPFF